MIDMDKYKGLTNDGKWIGTDADDSVIYYDAERDDYCTIALVQRDSDHYLTEDNPDIRLMVDAPLLLAEVKRLNMVINMLRRNDLWVSTEGWEESDKDDELLVSMNYLICTALEMRGDLND